MICGMKGSAYCVLMKSGAEVRSGVGWP